MATFIVCFVLFWMFYFLGTPFTSKEKEYLRIAKLERELIKKIYVSVKETGYLKKKIGHEIFYIPALIINVYNFSENEFENLKVMAKFSIEKKTICRSFSILKKFKPGERKKVLLKCMDFMAFGTVIQGITLSNTMREIHYEISLRTEATSAKANPIKGILKFKTLTPFNTLTFK
jgi:hypothetical protein